jgi:serine/threonine protein kinase/tetratricopeptide (TPR) repeat protein
VCERPGTRIGPYKLLEPIGEGGMGTVWMAQQTEPVKRLVAVKLIKPGMDSKQILARFEAERQALALMDHPNIAKVHDAGTTPDGRPYFVMELVKGVPLTRYCDEQRLTPRQRLELFVPVCQAIQHAHHKGVIHRDVKPSNVLVARYDERPVPKVIDFGVAKATGSQLTEETLHTGFGAVVGTVEYMSPEQASLNQLDVDTRSDVYSLGVLLYELLTGSPPFTRKELEPAGVLELLRVIREQEPTRPSTRLSTAEGLPTLAANRGTEPRRLSALVRGELDWIVMKCLEKDRSRRYETANGLARDLERYLHDEPVHAGPPSARYRLRKLVRKHRAGLSVAAVIVLLLVAGAAVSTWQAVRATRANTLATRRLAQVEKSNAILTAIFDDVDIRAVKAGPEPLEAVLAKRLVKAAGELEAEAVGDPLVVAELQNRLGETLRSLGHSPEAIPLFVKARETNTAMRGLDHPDTLKCMNNLASAYKATGQLDKALPLFEETLAKTKEKLGPDHPNTLGCMGNLALAYQDAGQRDKALPLFEETLAKSKEKLGPDHPSTLTSMHNLASAYQDAGQLDKALPLHEETLAKSKEKLGPDHPDTLGCMNNLAEAYRASGQLDKALPLQEQTLAKRKEKLGPDHPDTLTSMNNLALAYQDAGQLDKALPLFEETLKLHKAKLGAEHPDTLTSMNDLAALYWRQQRLDRSIPLFEETLQLKEKNLGRQHPQTLQTLANLGVNYKDAGRLAEAIPLLEEAYTAGKKHPGLRWVGPALLDAYGKDGRPSAAAKGLVAELLEDARKRLPRDSPQLAGQLASLGLALLQLKAFAEAEPLLRECQAIRAQKAPEDWTTFNTKSMLGGALLGQKKYAEAEPLLLAGYEGMKQRQAQIPGPWRSIRLGEALERLVQLYDAGGKPDEAAKWRKEAEALKASKPAPKSKAK